MSYCTTQAIIRFFLYRINGIYTKNSLFEPVPVDVDVFHQVWLETDDAIAHIIAHVLVNCKTANKNFNSVINIKISIADVNDVYRFVQKAKQVRHMFYYSVDSHLSDCCHYSFSQDQISNVSLKTYPYLNVSWESMFCATNVAGTDRLFKCSRMYL